MHVTTLFAVIMAFITFASAVPMTGHPEQRFERLHLSTPERITAARAKVDQRRRDQQQSVAAANVTAVDVATGTTPNKAALSEVTCSKPALVQDDLDMATQMLKDWCDDGGKQSAFTHRSYDYGTARVSLCNWGWEQPCSGSEIDDAWRYIDDKCPDDKPASGHWYEKDWAKGYWRHECTTGWVCDTRFWHYCDFDGRSPAPLVTPSDNSTMPPGV